MARRPRARARPRVDWRRSASERGYDNEWKKLARQFRREHPLCQHCEARGVVRPASLVDHRIPIRGPDDPRRLEWNNLQSLCRGCHAVKTAAETGAVRDAGG